MFKNDIGLASSVSKSVLYHEQNNVHRLNNFKFWRFSFEWLWYRRRVDRCLKLKISDNNEEMMGFKTESNNSSEWPSLRPTEPHFRGSTVASLKKHFAHWYTRITQTTLRSAWMMNLKLRMFKFDKKLWTIARVQSCVCRTIAASKASMKLWRRIIYIHTAQVNIA